MKISSLLIDIADTLPIAPRDFSWKMRWRMKHDRNPLFIDLLDKYKVKEYARRLGVRTAETFYVTDQPETIPFDSLPEKYFLKANHGCRWNILYEKGKFYLFGDGKNFTDPNNVSDYELTREEVISHCKSWLRSRYSKRQWAYQYIHPLIIAEEVLVQKDGGELHDYKFYTFHGKIRLIKIFTKALKRDHKEILLDENWQEIKLANNKDQEQLEVPPKPERFPEMVAAVEKLSNGLDFVRVDLYDTTRGVTLGEMTIYALAGRLNSPTPDPKFNKWLGDQWTLPVPARSSD